MATRSMSPSRFAILGDISDNAIRAAIVERRQIETREWWDGLLAESKAQGVESRVTILTRDRTLPA